MNLLNGPEATARPPSMMCSGYHVSRHWPWCSADTAATLVTCSCKVRVVLQILILALQVGRFWGTILPWATWADALQVEGLGKHILQEDELHPELLSDMHRTSSTLQVHSQLLRKDMQGPHRWAKPANHTSPDSAITNHRSNSIKLGPAAFFSLSQFFRSCLCLKIIVRLAYSNIICYACIGIYKYLLALELSRKLPPEAGDGLAPSRDQDIHETNTLVNCQAASSAYMKINNLSSAR